MRNLILKSLILIATLSQTALASYPHPIQGGVRPVQKPFRFAHTMVARAFILDFTQEKFEQHVPYEALPADVKNAFSRKYPGVQIVGAEQELSNGLVTFEVKFLKPNTQQRIDVTYTISGLELKAHWNIDAQMIPEKTMNAFKTKFPNAKLLGCQQEVIQNQLLYRFKIEENGKKTKVRFDISGNQVFKVIIQFR